MSVDASFFDLVSAVSTSEHVYWSYTPHPHLLQLVDLDGYTPLPLLMTLHLRVECETVIKSLIDLKKGQHLIFPSDLNHFQFA